MTDENPFPTPQTPANLRRLRQLRTDTERLFGLKRPLTAALTIALAESADAIRQRDPTFEPEEDVSAIQAVAEAMVRKAMKGDSTAFAQIADRVEGKVGTRPGDNDEELDRHRVTVEATIEGVVEAMTRRRTEAPQPEPELLEHRQDTPHVVVDTTTREIDESTQQSDR